MSDDRDEEFTERDSTADDTSDVQCPYCGEVVEIALDPGGGPVQDYIEDCPICCRPWQVSVQFDEDGSASVSLAAEDESE